MENNDGNERTMRQMGEERSRTDETAKARGKFVVKEMERNATYKEYRFTNPAQAERKGTRTRKRNRECDEDRKGQLNGV